MVAEALSNLDETRKAKSMSEYDDTNRGVFFQPHPDQTLVGSGKLNIDGTESRICVLKEKLSRTGDPVRSVYMRIGVLFPNESDNEKAPNLSGPLDYPAEWKIAGWTGQNDAGKHYCSQRTEGEPEKKQDQTPAADSGWDIDDEIPF